MGNWLLYIGIFLCCTGVGIVPGAILIFVWGITQITSKEPTNTTINNYNFESEKFTDSYDWNTHTDGDTMYNEWKSKRKYNHKKDDFSDDTREKMK